MKLFCGVPARGGSERLAGKNVAALGGRPMIAHTIAAARASGCFDEVFVCTDAEPIAAAAREAGAVVPALLPAELAGPLVASHRACQWLRQHTGSDADVLVCLQPTSPLRSAQDIRSAVERFARGDLDFLVSVTPIDPHYFHWAVREAGDGWGMYFGDRFLVERPQLPPVHRPNGSIKIAKFAALERTGHFFGKPLGVVETPEERSVHVATAFELALCEALLAGQPR